MQKKFIFIIYVLHNDFIISCLYVKISPTLCHLHLINESAYDKNEVRFVAYVTQHAIQELT